MSYNFSTGNASFKVLDRAWLSYNHMPRLTFWLDGAWVLAGLCLVVVQL